MLVKLRELQRLMADKLKKATRHSQTTVAAAPASPNVDTRYQHIREISSGAFGFVKLGKEKETGEFVAIKHMERGPKIDKHVLYEIMNHRNLLHHHVIRFKEVYLTEQHLCIVMEYASGGDLLQRVMNKNGLTEGEARWYFQQLVLGLDYCHQMGVMSRDIKLENALLDGREWPLLKICDFGYSKHHQKNSLPGSRVGTPAYVAPEIVMNKSGCHYDGKIADIWSCGVCLYAMVYASYPFDSPQDRKLNFADKLNRMLNRIVNDLFLVPPQPYVSPELRDLLFKIMVKEPEDRISLQEIMHHSWFQKDLPRGAMDMNTQLKEQSTIQTEEEICSIVEAAKIPFTGNEFGDEYIDNQLSEMRSEKTANR